MKKTKAEINEENYRAKGALDILMCYLGMEHDSQGNMFIYNDDDAFDLWKTGLGEAFNGSSDYFVQIELHYAADMNLRKPVGMVNRITWKLAVVKTGTVIDGETVTDITKMSNGQEDLGALTLDLVNHINNAIKA